MAEGDEIILKRYGLELRRSDYNLLDPPGWINDRLIIFACNFWEFDFFVDAEFLYLTPQTVQELRFIEPENVDEFLAPFKFKERDVIFFPINDSPTLDTSRGHWSLAVYVKYPAHYFDIVDSCKNKNMEIAQDIMKKTYAHIGVEPVKPEIPRRTPQQKNDYDCGIYMLMFIEYYCNMHYGRSVEMMEFEINPRTVTRRRSEMKELIDEKIEKEKQKKLAKQSKAK